MLKDVDYHSASRTLNYTWNLDQLGTVFGGIDAVSGKFIFEEDFQSFCGHSDGFRKGQKDGEYLIK